jgi:hypothetical protein
MVVAFQADMADVLRTLATPYFLIVDFALDAPGVAAVLAVGAAVLVGVAAHWM